jgi:Tfp pilus assembly pilus retraction ATPase PilT
MKSINKISLKKFTYKYIINFFKKMSKNRFDIKAIISSNINRKKSTDLKNDTPYYIKLFYKLCTKYNISDILSLNSIKDITDDVMKNIFLSQDNLHKEFINILYPNVKYYDSLEDIQNDKFDINYFFYLKENNQDIEISDENHVIFKNKMNSDICIGYFIPSININMIVDKFFFIDKSIYAYYYNTKSIDVGLDDKNNINDILEYMENSDISDFHFQLLDEYSYYLTARFGQDILRLTNKPINKDYIDKLYNQFLIKIGKDNLSNPPEVSGLITEKILSIKGYVVNRTFRFHSMFDNKGSFQGRAVSIRRLMSYDEISSLGLDGLNYSKKAIDIISRAYEASSGIIFITGKTNSGKTTLLSCILSDIYKLGRRIKSIESPVEIVAPYSQVDLTKTQDAEEKYKMTKEIAIAALLRQDPDVVLIQEVRTKSEVDEFIELGIKGHLAFSTMHTGGVEETIKRALKSVDNPADLKSSLKLIVSQSLVRKKCQICKGEQLIYSEKCKNCNGLGSKGVLPIYEIAYMGETNDSKYDIQNISNAVINEDIEYISKHEIMKDYYNKDLVFKEDYERVIKHEKNIKLL